MLSGHTTKYLIVAFCILAGAAPCSADDINVGEVQFAIPDPTDFAPVTPEMEPLYKFTKQLVPASNQEFLSYIPAAEVETALQGQMPNLERRFSLQGYRQLIPVIVSTADFDKIKAAFKSENQKNFDKIRGQIPDLMDKISKGLEKEFDVSAAFSVSSIIPSPVHLDTPQLLAFSALTQYEIRDEADQAVQVTVAGTTTFALVRGKLLYLYCYAGKSDMEWTRQISQQWAEAILAANPGEPEQSDAPQALIQRIDWTKVGITGLVGGAAGAIVGLLKYVTRRRRPRAN